MLHGLGFRSFAYDWRDEDIPRFGMEIEALKERGVKLIGWSFPWDPTSPIARSTLEVFKAHSARPQLWTTHSMVDWNSVGSEINKLLPPNLRWPVAPETWEALSPAQRKLVGTTLVEVMERMEAERWPHTPQGTADRVKLEAERVKSLVALAKPYHIQLALYSHNGWLGVPDHQVAVLTYLRRIGIRDVGIVYNFSHSHDGHHNDTEDFNRVWKLISSYVAAVNIAGVHREDAVRELSTPRSTWRQGFAGIRAACW
jgi:hypothetical protein